MIFFVQMNTKIICELASKLTRQGSTKATRIRVYIILPLFIYFVIKIYCINQNATLISNVKHPKFSNKHLFMLWNRNMMFKYQFRLIFIIKKLNWLCRIVATIQLAPSIVISRNFSTPYSTTPGILNVDPFLRSLYQDSPTGMYFNICMTDCDLNVSLIHQAILQYQRI